MISEATKVRFISGFLKSKTLAFLMPLLWYSCSWPERQPEVVNIRPEWAIYVNPNQNIFKLLACKFALSTQQVDLVRNKMTDEKWQNLAGIFAAKFDPETLAEIFSDFKMLESDSKYGTCILTCYWGNSKASVPEETLFIPGLRILIVPLADSDSIEDIRTAFCGYRGSYVISGVDTP